jgi:hypothetical protein
VHTLGRMQRGLETLYRVDTGARIEDFVVDEALRDAVVAITTGRRPREQLLVCESDGAVDVALFVAPSVLANLAANDPARHLGDHNLGDFLLAVEGVSHFVYALWCARSDRAVSQLELELQAEIDKYITCLLATDPVPDVSSTLRHRLFGDVEYDSDLDDDEHERYRAANDNALRYAGWLEDTFVARRRIPEMLGELRRFYRLGLAAKLAAIARAA